MSVKISARALLYNRHAFLGVMGSLFRQDGDKRNKFLTDIRVPMVDYSSNYTQSQLQNLEPGNYFIQVSLPNGRIITQKFQIQSGEDTEVIILIPHEGPHEWSTLHAMTGQFTLEAQKTAQFMKTLSSHSLPYTQLREHPENGYSLSLLKPQELSSTEVFKPANTLDRLSTLIKGNLNVSTAQQSLGHAQIIESPSLEDDDFAIFRFGHSGLLQGEEPNSGGSPVWPISSVNRHYLIQNSKVGAHIICLPTPWTTPDGEVDVELLVKKHVLDRELDYSITISDPMVNSVLGYINMGAVHLAQRLIDVEHAQDMLYNKISYPLAATIGGYILVLGRNTNRYRSESSSWKSWVSNLDNWFDWLPDGAILHAAMLLMDRNPNLTEAREALMRGYSRGLPFFTFGLKNLLDGMRFFAGKGDPQAQEHLQVLERIASRADPGVPFLSVNFSNTWKEEEATSFEASHYA